MKLEGKKKLVSRALGIGKNRISFNIERMNEVKEAITKQDMKDLVKNGAVIIKDKGGRKKVEKRKTRRKAGSIRKKVVDKKRNYILLTRKLRRYLSSMKRRSQIGQEEFIQIRKEIRAKQFKNLGNMKERLSEIISQKNEKKIKKKRSRK